jgi:tetratricopeptide (TPR) repeat protein
MPFSAPSSPNSATATGGAATAATPLTSSASFSFGAAPTTPRGERRTFHRGVIDALHTVLRDRRPGSRPASSETSGLLPSVARPQPPTPHSARCGGSSNGATGGFPAPQPASLFGQAERAEFSTSTGPTDAVRSRFGAPPMTPRSGARRGSDPSRAPRPFAPGGSLRRVRGTASFGGGGDLFAPAFASLFPEAGGGAASDAAADVTAALLRKRGQWARQHSLDDGVRLGPPSSAASSSFFDLGPSAPPPLPSQQRAASGGAWRARTLSHDALASTAGAFAACAGATSAISANDSSTHSSSDATCAAYSNASDSASAVAAAAAAAAAQVAAPGTASTSSLSHPSGGDGLASSCSSQDSTPPQPLPPPPLAHAGLPRAPVTSGASSATALAARATALKLEGNRLYAARQYVDAHRAYSHGLDADPRSAVLLSNRAAVSLSLNNVDAAIRDCQQAVAVDPAFWRAHVRLGRALALRCAFDGARDATQRALALFADFAASGATAAASASTGSAPSRPGTAAAGASASAPDADGARSVRAQQAAADTWERARLEHDAGNAAAALRLLDSAAFRDSVFADDIAVRVFRARLLLASDVAACRADLARYVPAAIATLESALGLTYSLYPTPAALPAPLALPLLVGNYVSALCELLVVSARAALLAGWHHAANARSTLRLCAMLRPDCAPCAALERVISAASQHIEDAGATMAAGRPAEAHASLTLALTVDPSNARLRVSVLLLRAEASIALGRHEAAATDCSEVLALEPGNTRALLRRSQAFERAANLALARRDVEAAAALRPELLDELAAFNERHRGAAPSAGQHQQQQQSEAGPSASSRRRQDSARPRRDGSFSGSGGGSDDASFGRSQSFSGDARMPQSSSSGFSWDGRRPSSSHGGGGGGAMPPQSQPASGPTLYEVLGVAPDSDGSAIKAQYRRLTLLVHPDKVVGESEAVRRQCEARFKDIAQAYAVLADDEQRAEYDVSLALAAAGY